MVVGDGLGSRSTPAFGNPPWHSAVEAYVLDGAVRQFSYYRAGFHYDGRHTTVRLERSRDRFAAYFPAPGVTTTFVAFSLAGPIFTLGLGQWVEQKDQGSVPCLILVQPAFALHEGVYRAWRRSRVRISAVVKRTLAPRRVNELHNDVERAVRRISSLMNVYMLIWYGDQFIAYPPELIERLRVAGAISLPLENITFPPDMANAFQRHCYVARAPEVLERIAELVTECRMVPRS